MDSHVIFDVSYHLTSALAKAFDSGKIELQDEVWFDHYKS
jgi:hypothetical protein